ncbi:MAG: glycosyltransferase [Kiritimatiellae bacterium]|nr:glycosyltransferase [Kiritimatiellia bacterium]
MTDPTVSVIVGVYNREKYVREAVDSVLAQSFGDFELIVVDDASTDGTDEALQSYGDRVRLIRRDRNSGLPSVPRNEGMAIARGRYFAFLDSDDFWYPEKLREQVGFLEAQADVPFCHALCHIVDEASRVLYVRREGEMPVGEDVFHHLLRDCFITTSAVMIRAGLYRRIGGFNEDPRLQRGEDREFFLRAAGAGSIGFVPKVLAAHRRFGENISGERYDFQKSILRTQKWVMEHPELWRARAGASEARDGFVDACLGFSYFWRQRGNFRRAGYFNLRAWKEAPFSARANKALAGTIAAAARGSSAVE